MDFSAVYHIPGGYANPSPENTARSRTVSVPQRRSRYPSRRIPSSESRTSANESITLLRRAGRTAEPSQGAGFDLTGLLPGHPQLRRSIQELEDSAAYIDWKQNFYDEVLSGQRPYESSLIQVDP